MLRFLSQLLNIRPYEWPRLLILSLMAFLFILGIIWAQAIVEAGFLVRVGTEFLPYIFIGDALVAILAIAIYTAFVDRIANDAILIGISLITVLCVAVGLVLLGIGSFLVAFPFLYLLFRVVRDTFSLHWGTYINGFYDTRAAKRIIPLLSSVVRIAVIVAGASLVGLNLVFGSRSTEYILLLWGVTMGLVALLAFAMPYWLHERNQPDGVRTSQTMTIFKLEAERRTSYLENIREGYRFVLQSRYLQAMAIAVMLSTIVIMLLNFQALKILADQLVTAQDISTFTGSVSSVGSLIILPIQLFLFSRLVGRIGLGNASLIYPASTALVAGLILFFPTELFVAALIYFNINIFSIAFRHTVDDLLYNAVAVRIKGRSRAFISGFLIPVGILIAGLIALLPISETEWFLPGSIAALSGIYLISAFNVRRQYAQALITMLEQEDFSILMLTQTNLRLADSSILARLYDKLKESQSDDFTIFIAKIIAELGQADAIPILEEVYETGSAPVRSAIIDILATSDIRHETVNAIYINALLDPEARVRKSAIAGLEQMAGAQSEQYLSLALELIQDPNPEVRAQVLPALIKSGDFLYLMSAISALNRLIESEDAKQRVTGLRLLGQVADVRFIRGMTPYLEDPSDEVRLASAIAIEELTARSGGIPPQIGEILRENMPPHLVDPIERVRIAAIRTLGRLNTSEAIEAIVFVLTDASPQVRDAAVDEIVRIGKPALPSLEAALREDDMQLNKMATVVLSRIRRQDYSENLYGYIDQNLKQIYSNLVQIAALENTKHYRSVGVMQSIFREQNMKLTDEIFYFLRAIHPASAVEVIHHSLQSQEARVRANAVEAFESMTSPHLASLIAPLLDPEPDMARLLRRGERELGISGMDPIGVIRKLLTDKSNSWFRTIMTFAIGEMGAVLYEADKTKSTPPPPKTPRNVKDLLGGLSAKPANQEKSAASPDDDETIPEATQVSRPTPAKRRPLPSDLFGSVMNYLENKDKPTPEEEKLQTLSRADEALSQAQTDVVALPTPPFSLQEIQVMLQYIINDDTSDVRVAAKTARRMITGEQIIKAVESEHTLLSSIEKLLFLKEVPLFQGLMVEQLKTLAAVCEEQFFAADSIIFDEEQPGGVLYMIVSGRVGIERKNKKTGTTTRLNTLTAHHYFGEDTLFDESPNLFGAVAIQDTLALRLQQEPLVALARQYPDLSLELIKLLSRRLREVTDQAASLKRSISRQMHKVYDKLE